MISIPLLIAHVVPREDEAWIDRALYRAPDEAHALDAHSEDRPDLRGQARGL